MSSRRTFLLLSLSLSLFLRLEFFDEKSLTYQHLVQRLGVEQDLAQLRRAVTEPDAERVGVDLLGCFFVVVKTKRAG